ncbi:polynucleotide adenylyltransferase PcnB [Aliagarivorans taiwanensis]|uniref:polynucleotide adenylyltransferase PcnB n=1 Tax=Aliagarivorans taiwanensis TaxID=561966 RepID=UPI00040BFF5E|nr:polynucleotide adenylyltransferase PcnB [Aliagarivorans taiwanensis]
MIKPQATESEIRLEKQVIGRDQHNISRQDISENALKVLYRLHKSGYEAYLVGGGVRDLLLGKHPKDFDIATNATPEQIQKLFRNCRLVGRRFRLAHILFGRDIIEVATFRGHHVEAPDKHAKQSDEGMLLRDNVYGGIDEDAERRDFTVNALYYNIADFSVVDFAGGIDDIEARRLQLIGDPETRYREDPVRMLRAVRFAVKLDFEIAPSCGDPIPQLAHLLKDIPAARLFEECLKLFMAGHGVDTFKMLQQTQLLFSLFPLLKPLLQEMDERDPDVRFILAALASTDRRVNNDQKVTPAFIFAALLWPLVQQKKEELLIELSLGEHDAMVMAMGWVLDQQCKSVAIPRRFTTGVREIWQLQSRLSRRHGKRAFATFGHPRFRAAYDFLELRAQTSEDPEQTKLVEWWQLWQQSNEPGRSNMLRQLNKGNGPRKRRRKPRKPSASQD